jgi:hypothetical protein
MQEHTEYFQNYIEVLYSEDATELPDVENDGEPPTPNTENSCIGISINWKSLNIDRPTQTIAKSADSKTILEMLRLLLIEFGNDMEEQLKSQPIIRFKLSENPKSDFMNHSTGKPYAYLQIPETNLYFCPQSGRLQKVERLRSLFSRLRLPNGHFSLRRQFLLPLRTNEVFAFVTSFSVRNLTKICGGGTATHHLREIR